MEKLIVTITKGSEDYSAWVENCPGLYGVGNSVEQAKENLREGLALYVKHNKILPDVLKGEYEWEYHFDVTSFLEYYSRIFSEPALERLTGINRKQLSHYISGYRKPSGRIVKKLDDALHHFAEELDQVHFVDLYE
jgi:predicted RNase H-like HicB family nuclease